MYANSVVSRERSNWGGAAYPPVSRQTVGTKWLLASQVLTYQSQQELVEYCCPNNTHNGDEEGYDASNNDDHCAREIARASEEVEVGASVYKVAATSDQSKTNQLWGVSAVKYDWL